MDSIPQRPADTESQTSVQYTFGLSIYVDKGIGFLPISIELGGTLVCYSYPHWTIRQGFLLYPSKQWIRGKRVVEEQNPDTRFYL